MNFTFDLDMRAFFGIPNFDVWSLGHMGKTQPSLPLITRFLTVGRLPIFPADQYKHSTAHAAVALCDSWIPSWHTFFSSSVLQSVSNERFPGSCPLHQQSF